VVAAWPQRAMFHRPIRHPVLRSESNHPGQSGRPHDRMV
jgi:hypothetical protein